MQKGSSWVCIPSPSVVRTGRRHLRLSRWTSVKRSVHVVQCCLHEPVHRFIKRIQPTATYNHGFSESYSASLCFSYLLVSLRPWVTSDLWPQTRSGLVLHQDSKPQQFLMVMYLHLTWNEISLSYLCWCSISWKKRLKAVNFLFLVPLLSLLHHFHHFST